MHRAQKMLRPSIIFVVGESLRNYLNACSPRKICALVKKQLWNLFQLESHSRRPWPQTRILSTWMVECAISRKNRSARSSRAHAGEAHDYRLWEIIKMFHFFFFYIYLIFEQSSLSNSYLRFILVTFFISTCDVTQDNTIILINL